MHVSLNLHKCILKFLRYDFQIIIQRLHCWRQDSQRTTAIQTRKYRLETCRFGCNLFLLYFRFKIIFRFHLFCNKVSILGIQWKKNFWEFVILWNRYDNEHLLRLSSISSTVCIGAQFYGFKKGIDCEVIEVLLSPNTTWKSVNTIGVSFELMRLFNADLGILIISLLCIFDVPYFHYSLQLKILFLVFYF